MKSMQFYKYATWGMLGLNLTLLALFFFGRPPGGMGQRAIETLRLDEAQHADFLTSAKSHDALMQELLKKQHILLKPYFQQLIKPKISVDEQQLWAKMQQLESQKIQSTYQHFKEIKNILKEEQKADFELFMNRMLERILIEKEKKPHPPKEF